MLLGQQPDLKREPWGVGSQGNELGVLGDDPDLRFHLLVDDVGSTLSSTSAASPVVPADNMDTVVVARVDAQPCEVRVSGLGDSGLLPSRLLNAHSPLLPPCGPNKRDIDLKALLE